jgi:hypothetical protein
MKEDRNYVLAVVEEKGNELEHALGIFRQDREVCLAAIKSDWMAIKFVAKPLACSHEILLATAVKLACLQRKIAEHATSDEHNNNGRDSCFFNLVEGVIFSENHRGYEDEEEEERVVVNRTMVASDKTIMLATINSHLTSGGWLLQHCASELQSDRTVVLAAVSDKSAGSSALQWASEELRADPDVVRCAVRNFPKAFQHALGEAATGDRGIVLQAVEGDGRNLQYAAVSLRADKEIVLVAVASEGGGGLRGWGGGGGLALEFASEELQADKEVVLLALSPRNSHLNWFAVRGTGSALEFASEELQADEEVVLAAVTNHGSAVIYAANKFRTEKIPALRLLSHGTSTGHCLKYMPELCGEKECVMTALRHAPRSQRPNFYSSILIGYTSEEMRADPDVMMLAVQTDPLSIMFMNTDASNKYRIMPTLEAPAADDNNQPMSVSAQVAIALELMSRYPDDVRAITREQYWIYLPSALDVPLADLLETVQTPFPKKMRQIVIKHAAKGYRRRTVALADPEFQYQIFYRNLQGSSKTLTVHSADMVEDIKEQISHKEGGIPANQQRLIYSGEQLEDGYSLREYLIGPEFTLDLVLRLRGSDRRLKCDIKRVGVSPSGIPEYTYRYRAQPAAVYHGVMAQDLLRMGFGDSGVVERSWWHGGMWAVDYHAIDVCFRQVA